MGEGRSSSGGDGSLSARAGLLATASVGAEGSDGQLCLFCNFRPRLGVFLFLRFFGCWSDMTATGTELAAGQKGGAPDRGQGGSAETTRDDGCVADAEERR